MPSRRRLLTPDWRWFIIAVTLVILIFSPLRHTIEGAVVVVSRPMIALGRSINQRFHPGVTVEQITKDRDALRDQVAALTARLAEAQQALEINTTATALTTFVDSLQEQAVMAGVIAYSPDPGIESIVIARGRDDGVEPGLAVVTANGVMIGKVHSSASRTSTVLLLNDSHSQVAARIQNQPRSPGIISGERGLAMVMNFIPTGDEVKPGQTVVTAGTEALVPPDILIGTVRTTQSQAGELFRRAIIASPVELNRVRVVAVINVRS